MRRARPILAALLLLLALAPTASAHGDDEPDHRDTPADLRGADITRTLAIAHLTSTTSPNLAQYAPTTWCGSRLTTDDTEYAAFSRVAAADQGRLRLRQRPAGPVGAVERRAAGQRLEHRAVPGRADGRHPRAALRHGHRVRAAVRRHPGRSRCPQARAYYRDDPSRTSTASRHDVAAAARLAVRPARRLRPGRRLTDDPACGASPQVIDDDSAGAGNDSNAGGLTAIMWTNPLDPARSVGFVAADGDAPRDHAQPRRRPAVGAQPHLELALHRRRGRHVLPDGSPEAAAYDDTVCPLDRRRDPADLRLRPRRLLQPRAGAGQLPRHALERLPQRLHGRRAPSSAWPAESASCRRRRSTPRCPTVAGAAAARRATRPRGRAPGSTRPRATRCAGSGPRRGLGDIPARRGRLPAHRRRRRRRPARDGHRDQRDGAAIVASAPTAPVAAYAAAGDSAPSHSRRSASSSASRCAIARTTPRARWRRASSRSRPGARCARTRSRSR